MKVYVLDASVILNFLLGKDKLSKKRFINLLKQVRLNKISLHATYLLPLEVGNGLLYFLSDKFLAKETLEKFLNLPINFFIFRPSHYLKILRLSQDFGTSFYDASYHFLAKLLKGTFLTSDEQYFKKAKESGNIKLL